MKINKKKSSELHETRWVIWPSALSGLVTIFMIPLSELLHISLIFMPLLGLLVWVPFLVVQAIRLWRELEREKQELQAKFDGQDNVLFGGKFKSS